LALLSAASPGGDDYCLTFHWVPNLASGPHAAYPFSQAAVTLRQGPPKTCGKMLSYEKKPLFIHTAGIFSDLVGL
jgi:hypothetical protein